MAQDVGSSLIQSLLSGITENINEKTAEKKRKKVADIQLQEKLTQNQAVFEQGQDQLNQAMPGNIARQGQLHDAALKQEQADIEKKVLSFTGKKGPDGVWRGGNGSDMVNKDPRRAHRFIMAMRKIPITPAALPPVAPEVLTCNVVVPVP